MFYNEIEKLSSCLTGVKREVFEQMRETMNEVKFETRKHPNRETPAKLSNVDKKQNQRISSTNIINENNH